MRLFRYRKVAFPEGWMCLDGDTWEKEGINQRFTRAVMEMLPYECDDLNADIPIFNMLRDYGVDISDFYEYRGEPRTFNVWLPETKGKPLAAKMEDVIKIQVASNRISTGEPDLDEILKDGIPADKLSKFYGRKE